MKVQIGNPQIGDGTWIGEFTVLDGSGGLEIGRGCDISRGVQIYTHSTANRCTTGRASPNERRPTKIGDNVFVGADAIILMGCTIGDRVKIGAGTVVLEGTTIPDGSTVVGNPARVVKHEDRSD